ncbi:dol-P-Man:Man(6)GlcNAc(2)-PP-Dol alpha-1,2-mannosyltransferase [Dendrobium catenatum]|uniref:Mannosyltransferase n=1 Tax=Dendrobium catenatum TaxID=906689 RepID=A0A2I0X337_9ASPA|nr:dol-P-Man:Man(6)GlcNAc(2)-PP-Dol alpha-1,2-mannosyltransferase [Dendrobium catenatum]XP_028549625.1 dol-P-Man:Man(6)GlcNAc(2)-PP-Dol alpha-1,2-mannosyltransferase [Dendrobium catenatum]PKU82316.1 Dol-P-Man:Man(6)GlcNAc(2)-PP-Dol alpha-1,2-mannosyltransferase [Dendrobium catenatum]
MALKLPRHRRQAVPERDLADSAALPADRYSKEDKGDKPREKNEKGLRWQLPFLALGLLRHMSASSNIIHDCDEVFNYWEPLHYLLYKSGFQTWEYSSEFALRSYLYLLFHMLVAGPTSWFYKDEKIQVFYKVRLFLGLISTITETVLIVALSRKYGKRLATYTLAMLCLTSGCFFSSTSFLPSTFSMYAVTLSSALFLLEKYASAVSVSAAGVLIGWPFSILIFLPVTIYSLIKGSFKKVFLSGLITSVSVIVLSVYVDYYYYGKWTSSIFNLLKYNVLGGGESHLYGVESATYYLRNGFNNFNFSFILALLFVALLPITLKKYTPDLLVVVSPIYIWLAFMSLQPHKEERFLYPIYTLICVAATAVIDIFPDIFRDRFSTEESFMVKVAKVLRPVFLGLILCASHSRTFSLLHGYSGPLVIYKHLEHHEDASPGSILCVGSEWHRYPSSFFIPSYVKEVRWIDDGFRGLLPFPFNSTLGGTAAAPSYFNNKNKASDMQYLHDIDACTLFVELDLRRPHPSRGRDLSKWETLAAVHYLDRELSPAIYRSFFIPYSWHYKNVFGLYKLLRKIPQNNVDQD